MILNRNRIPGIGVLFFLVCLLHLWADAASLPRSQWLVEVSWLKEHLQDSSVIVADVRSEHHYLQGHIPGAIWMDISGINARTSDSALTQLHKELAEKFMTLGIAGAEQVVFYDEAMGTRAPKALWFLTYAGYNWGRVLHGGFAAWQQSGLSVSTDKSSRPPRKFSFNANPGVLASSDYVSKRIKSQTTVILDVRSHDEYSGKDSSGHCARTGHIPGAVWLEWTQLLDGPLSYRDVGELQRRLAAVGATPDKEIITYCHQGNRASNSYLALQLLGYANVKNYIGSWHEWASRLDLPIEHEE